MPHTTTLNRADQQLQRLFVRDRTLVSLTVASTIAAVLSIVLGVLYLTYRGLPDPHAAGQGAETLGITPE